MSAASSAAGATLQPVARILFIISSVQIMITSCQSAHFDGSYVDKYFTDEQCPSIDHVPHISLEECLDLCLSHRGPTACTAVNYGVSNSGILCDLRACKMPVPLPAGDWSDVNAYSLKPAHFNGPFVGRYFTLRQCPFITSFYVQSVAECLDLCFSYRGPQACTAVNYRGRDNYCALLECPLPVLPPAGNSPDYNAYSLKPEVDFNGPYVDKYYPGDQCPFIAVDYGQSVEECLDLCLLHRGPPACTAVNYGGSDNHCVLRACIMPVPLPAGNAEGVNAYSLKRGDCYHFGGFIFEDKCLLIGSASDVVTWKQARSACSFYKGELAIFSDDPKGGLEFKNTRSISDDHTTYWVGGKDADKDGYWEWDNGVKISTDPNVFPWGKGEPKDATCLASLISSYGSGYNGEDCLNKYQYVCELGCSFNGIIYPPGTFIQEACAHLQCNGNTGRFNNVAYDDHCKTCTAWGDPHIITYDMNSYDTTQTGNCSLSKDGSSSAPPIGVYGEFETCGDGGVSCLKDISFKNDENTFITCSFDISSNKLKIQVNGRDFNVDTLTSSPSLLKVDDTDYPVLAWTSTYRSLIGDGTGNPHIQSCLSLQGSSGLLVQFCGDNSKYWANSVNIWAHSAFANTLNGFCGNNNGKWEEICTSTKFHQKEDIGAFSLSKIETKCETNTSLPNIFQNKCEDAILNGVHTAHTNMSQFLIDACVYDLCYVSDPEEWIGSVHASMPKHHENKENTVGHCKHKRSHNCKTHNGTCILKTEICDGTIIERGCHGHKCACCAPNPCEQDAACLNRQGKCILRKDWATCDGSLNSELCSGPDCACCYTKTPKKCGESKKCSKVNGDCIRKKKWKDCDGKLKKKWCDGKKCGCCYQ